MKFLDLRALLFSQEEVKKFGSLERRVGVSTAGGGSLGLGGSALLVR